MLMVHGDQDYRVPIGEGLWVLKPQDSKLWYETVEAFLAGHERVAPEVLR